MVLSGAKAEDRMDTNRWFDNENDWLARVVRVNLENINCYVIEPFT
jgi:hypothetical protein